MLREGHEPGGIRRGPKGGVTDGWKGTSETASASPERLGVATEGRMALATGLSLVGASSPRSCCPRVGRDGAARVTLTVTLGAEKALGCEGCSAPGPPSSWGCSFLLFSCCSLGGQ